MAILFFKELLEVLKRDSIALLMLSIVSRVFHLQTVVCQVDVFVVQVLGLVLEARGTDVADIAEEEVLIAQRNGPHPNIKLPTSVQKWPLKVFLYDPV